MSKIGRSKAPGEKSVTPDCAHLTRSLLYHPGNGSVAEEYCAKCGTLMDTHTGSHIFTGGRVVAPPAWLVERVTPRAHGEV